MNYERHPLSACFGDMDADEFQALKNDIEAHGQHEPVLLFDGAVLDGWHRYLAVTQLGMKVQTFTFDGTFEEAQERVISSNDKRRHRTVAQRAQAIVAVTACRPVGRPKKNSAPGAELPPQPKNTAKAIAAKHGIGERSVERARIIEAAGLGPAVIDGSFSAKEAEAIATGKVEKKPKKTTLPPAPAPERGQTLPPPAEAPAPSDDFDPVAELERAHAEIQKLTAEIQAAEADDLKKEAIKWRRAYEHAERQQAEAMDRATKERRMHERKHKELMRCGKAVGETDPDKVVAAVLAFVRKHSEVTA